MAPLDPHPVLLTFAGFTLYTHGLFFALGAEFCYIFAHFLAKKRHLSSEPLASWVAIIFIGGLLAARIGFFITYPSLFHSLVQVLSIWQGGLVSYFGIIGGLVLAWWLLNKRADKLIWLDIFCLSALLAWAIGRWGNYFAADAYGVLSSHWTVFYGRVPIQILESFYCLVLWLLITKMQPKLIKQPGLTAFYVLVGYLVGRFCIDTWRDEARFGPLHFSQWVSLMGLIGVLGFYQFFKSSHRG